MSHTTELEIISKVEILISLRCLISFGESLKILQSQHDKTNNSNFFTFSFKNRWKTNMSPCIKRSEWANLLVVQIEFDMQWLSTKKWSTRLFPPNLSCSKPFFYVLWKKYKHIKIVLIWIVNSVNFCEWLDITFSFQCMFTDSTNSGSSLYQQIHFLIYSNFLKTSNGSTEDENSIDYFK